MTAAPLRRSRPTSGFFALLIAALVIGAGAGIARAGAASPNLGFTRAALWARLSLQRVPASPENWLLVVRNPVLDDITLYLPAGNGYRALRGGDSVAVRDTLPHRHHVFALSPPIDKPMTLYLRIATTSSLSLPIELMTPEAFYAEDHHEQIILGLFFGILLAVSLYLATLFVVTAEGDYAWLAGFLLALGFYQAGMTGVSGDLLWPGARWIDNYTVALCGAFAVFTAIGFTTRFIASADTLWWLRPFDRAGRSVALVPIALILIDHRATYLASAVLAIIAAVLITLACLRLMLLAGNRPARFFLAGWFVFLLGVVLLMSRVIGLLPHHPLINSLHLIGGALGAVCFAAALADRFRSQQVAVQRALRDSGAALEREVRARTAELSERNRELADAVAALEEARQQAELASKAKDSFLAHMSHELRTPLNAIIGFAEIIRDRVGGPAWSERYFEYAGDIHASGVHLLSLINDVLDLAKIESGHFDFTPEPVALGELLAECKVLVRQRARKAGVDLVDETGPGLPTIEGDRRALKQIIANLLSNAIKYTPAGGRAVLGVRSPADGGLAVTVADTGIGISPVALETIFRPFARGDLKVRRHFEGTGLGLAISRQLAELHQGRLDIASTEGHGTTATLWLPPARVQPAPTESAAVAT